MCRSGRGVPVSCKSPYLYCLGMYNIRDDKRESSVIEAAVEVTGGCRGISG